MTAAVLLGLLPVLVWAGGAAAAAQLGRSWRPAVLLGGCLWGVLFFLWTELPSRFHLLTWQVALLLWALSALAALGGAGAAIIWRWKTRNQREPVQPGLSFVKSREHLPVLLLASIVLASLVIGLVSLVAPPQVWDGMAYHLPRVMHWVYYRSCDFFPTANVRMLFMSPWPGYVHTQLHLLTGGDWLDNLSQWQCMVGSLVAVSWIVSLVGGGRKTQVAAAAICASIPMGVLQSQALQTDYMAGFWVVCALGFALSRTRDRPAFWRWSDRLGFGVAIGLAVAAKGTGYLLGAPIVLAFIVIELRAWQVGWIKWPTRAGAGVIAGSLLLSAVFYYQWRWLMVIGLVAGLGIGACVLIAGVQQRRWMAMVAIVLAGLLAGSLNAPHWVRNVRTFGSPFSPKEQDELLFNQRHQPKYLVNNMVKHLAAHLRVWEDDGQLARHPRSRERASINQWTEDHVRAFQSWLEIPDGLLDVNHRAQKFHLYGLNRKEDDAGNGLHTVLYLFCLAGLLLGWRTWRNPALLALSIIVWTGFALMCFQLKWQFWLSRLQTPWYVLMAPWAAMMLYQWFNARTAAAVGGVLLLCAIPWMINCPTRPLLGEHGIFHLDRMELRKQAHSRSSQVVQRNVEEVVPLRPERVGLITNGNTTIYNIWMILDHELGYLPVIEEVLPEHAQAAPFPVPPNPNFHPEVIFTSGWRGPGQIRVNGRTYVRSRHGRRSWGSSVYILEQPPAQSQD